MKALTFLYVIMIVLLIFPAISSAGDEGAIQGDPITYTFYPNSPIHLGTGVSPNNVAQPKVACISFEEEDIDHGAALQTYFVKTLVTNSEQLKKTLSLDSKIDASYLNFKGGASFSYSAKSMFASGSMTVVLTAYTSYGRKGIKNIRLNETGMKWISDPEKFAQYCGTRLPVVEYDASATYVIITVNNVTSEEQSEQHAALSAQGGWGTLNASASAHFDDLLEKHAGGSAMDIQVVATGGSGLSALGDVLKELSKNSSGLSMDTIQSAMGAYLASFSAKNSAPVAYDVTPMDFLGWNSSGMNLWNDLREERLRLMVTQYRSLSEKIDTIDSIISGTDSRSAFLTKEDISKVLPMLRKSYEDQRATIARAHRQCMEVIADPCEVPPTQDDSKNPIPDFPAPPAGYFVVLSKILASPLDTNGISYVLNNQMASKSLLTGLNPWSKGIFLGRNPATSAKLPFMRFAEVFGDEDRLMYLVSGSEIVAPMRMVFRENATGRESDLGSVVNACGSDTMRTNNELEVVRAGMLCIPIETGKSNWLLTTDLGAYQIWRDKSNPFGTKGNQSYAGGAAGYLGGRAWEWGLGTNDPACTDNSTHSGLFLLHLFDKFGREWYLPIFRGAWTTHHSWLKPPSGGCEIGYDSIDFELVI